MNHLENSMKIKGKEGLRLTPPIHIKNYECINVSTPKQNKHPTLKKSTSHTIHVDENKSDNSFTTHATKRKSDDKHYLDPINLRGKNMSISGKRSKNEFLEYSNKSFPKNVQQPTHSSKIKNNMMGMMPVPVIQRTRKKSATKSPSRNTNDLFGNSNNFDIKGTTQIYVNQLVVDKDTLPLRPELKDSNTSFTKSTTSNNNVSSNKIKHEALSKVVEDRKFSIMDIPGSIVNMHSKRFN
jgi:hypothetical protein